ncbi:MAG TPA: type II toxin-antitoxin system VapC family toxin [Caulobacteraceae bacterium]|nr:type II toxin-antitoxin system VapC family toxin [Caulobacteraceae bacterium]
MNEAIADSSTVLAYFAREPGGEQLLQVGSLRICAVNFAEIVGRLADWGLDDVAIDAALRDLPLHVENFDSYRASVAAKLRRDPSTRRLSLGDRACLSLALRTGLPVLTADRAWAELELGVDVRLIR